MKFSAKVITGSGRGKKLRIPTINIDPVDAPKNLTHGVYACKAFLDEAQPDTWLMGALHYGSRPVFKDSLSLEVHLIDQTITEVPAKITIDIVERLRDVQNFPSTEELKREIASDIARTRAILDRHAEQA